MTKRENTKRDVREREQKLHRKKIWNLMMYFCTSLRATVRREKEIRVRKRWGRESEKQQTMCAREEGYRERDSRKKEKDENRKTGR